MEGTSEKYDDGFMLLITVKESEGSDVKTVCGVRNWTLTKDLLKQHFSLRMDERSLSLPLSLFSAYFFLKV